MRIIKTENLNPAQLTVDDAHLVYNGLDAAVTLDCFNGMLPHLDSTSRATYEFSKALQAPVLEMMLRGVKVDQRRRSRTLQEMRAKLFRLESQLDEIVREGVGSSMNWRSPKQLGELLYDVMNLPEQKKRNTNNVWARTTDRDALEKLQSYFIAEPIISHLLLLRDLGKSIGFLETGIDSDGRMRCNFSIAGTNTGRWSSSVSDFGTGTNLQNVTEALRSVFVADPGMKFANLDLEQADARNVGALCWDLLVDNPDWNEATAGKYLDACEGGDLHTYVCRLASPQLAWDQGRTDREVAEDLAYRDKSFRQCAKVLGHGCLTEDHEVLTKTGWIKITEMPSEIMTWTLDKSEFAEVSNWTDKLYTGNLHRFSGYSQDVLMTADHRVPYIADQRRPILRVRSAKMGPQVFMPLGGGYIGGKEIVPAKLIAAVMADGSLEKNWTSFHFHKPRKVKRLIELCTEYGIEYKIHGDKVRIIGNFPKTPGAFMFNWTRKCLKEFIDELKYWDGHIGKTSVSIHSSKRVELEWYQVFGRLMSIGGNIQKPTTSGFGTTMYALQQNNRQWANGNSSAHEIIPVENRRVLCPTVPSSFFYIRRNGKISITGNSNYLGTPATMAKHSKLPIQTVKAFHENYFAAFPCIPAWHSNIIYQLKNFSSLTTLLNRRRFFFGRPTDAATHREATAYAPQSMTGDEINHGILNLWRANRVQLLIQVHDSILFQYPEELEDEIIPWALEALQTTIILKKGRSFSVPTEAKTGWNWGNYSMNEPNKADNYEGLKKWKGGDDRKRSIAPTQLNLSSLLK